MEDRSLLVSDLDGTLLGDAAATRRFDSWYQDRCSSWILVYASGRSFDSVIESVRESDLPNPAAIIGSVGTEIRWYPSGQAPAAWRDGFDSAWSADRVVRALGGHSELERQPAEFQSEYKVSYFLHDACPDFLARIQSQLVDSGIAADVIYSSGRDLDVVPKGANKGSAAEFVAGACGVSADRVIVCGDTGNDESMFRRGFRGVMPANALDELKALAGERNYLASALFADGVIEGINYWRKVAESK